MSNGLCVGLTATKGAWSAELRAHLRDHSQGISVQVIMDRANLQRIAPDLDIVVLDDLMRLFTASDIERLTEAGVSVFGVCHPLEGMGRQHLLALGAQHVVPADASAAEVVSLFDLVVPRTKRSNGLRQGGGWPGPGLAGERHGQNIHALVTVWTKVSGGAGLTEAFIAAGEHLATKDRVLLIELEEATPVLVSRLLRSPDNGLPWALARAAAGQRVLPEGLSGPRGDGVTPLGTFDAICMAPGPHPVPSPTAVGKLFAEVGPHYDHVLVESSCLVGSTADRERLSATNSALSRADRVVVMATSDPQGAASLVEWKAAALTAGVTAPCWAVFGRSKRSKYEQDHLRSLVERSTGRHPYHDVTFLPEDPVVHRARWNGELVWKGAWLRQVRSLTSMSVAGARAQATNEHHGALFHRMSPLRLRGSRA